MIKFVIKALLIKKYQMFLIKYTIIPHLRMVLNTK
jgi:hypothetical protein